MRKFYPLILGVIFTGLCGGVAIAAVAEPSLNVANLEKVELAKIHQSSKKLTNSKNTRAGDVPITSAPGEKTTFEANGKAWINYWGMLLYQINFTNLTDIYFDGEDVYVYNPVSQFPTSSYMKGTLKDDEIVFTFPQLIYQEEGSDGVVNDYYLSRLNGTEEETAWGSTWSYEVAETDNEIVFHLEDGKWVMEPSDYKVIFGLVDEEMEWVGYGDCDIVYQEFTATPIEAPAGLETEEWVLVANGGGQAVNVGFIGDEVYIQGVSAYIPDAWIKGTVNNDKIIFEGGQYMGSYNSPGGFYLAYLIGGEVYPDGTNYTILPEIEFSYDAEAKSMSYKYTLFVNSNTEYIRYLEIYDNPLIHFQPATFDLTPAPAELTYFQEYNGSYMGVQFIIPNLTADGYLLDTENLYWRLLVDGEVYEFDEELYGELDNNQTEVPYDYYSPEFDIYGSGPEKTLILYAEGFDVLSIQTINKTEVDGIEQSFYGVPMNYNILTGDITYGGNVKVEGINSAEIMKEEYYNLNGIKVNNPENGLYIKRSTYSDGTVKSVKVMNR